MKRLEAQGIWASSVQKFLGMAGTVAVITAMLVGSAVGLLAAVVSNHKPWAAFPAGAVTAAATLTLLIRFLDREIEAARRDMHVDGD
jgi:MFS-type transporter involved in bile tolerance (Atg22 family)